MNSFFYEKLADTCHNLLFQNKKVLHYLKTRRGITEETIRSYRLGAFPKKLRRLTGNITWEELIEHGVIWNAGKSPFKHYPLIIPIAGTNGVPVAIGGRTLYSDEKREELGIPKYYNSVYSKTSFLFGLDKAIEAIRHFNRVFVVEGYFDVIAAHQRGYKNVVATCGTIFSPRQMILLSRYTDNIVLLFDNDGPGRVSSERVSKKFERISHEGVNMSYEFTPEGYKDLDELITKGDNVSSLGLERMVDDEISI